MPYDNNSFDYDGVLDCELYNSKGELLKKFKVREYSAMEKTASFAAGGVASGDNLYMVSTSNRDVAQMINDKTIKAYSTQAVINGTAYKVVAARCEFIQIADDFLKRRKKESVITLK